MTANTCWHVPQPEPSTLTLTFWHGKLNPDPDSLREFGLPDITDGAVECFVAARECCLSADVSLSDGGTRLSADVGLSSGGTRLSADVGLCNSGTHFALQ